jgi:hypothetical protein
VGSCWRLRVVLERAPAQGQSTIVRGGQRPRDFLDLLADLSVVNPENFRELHAC